jgi:iron complex outermembrane receptor protein
VGDREVVDGLGATVADASTAWLPSLHYLWQLTPRWNVRASLAWAEKAPGVRELSPVIRTANGVNTLSNPDRAGNPALRPESTTTLQAGIEHFLADQRGSASLNFFLRDIDDKVQKRTALEASRYVERPFNVARATETSVVADFKWKLASLPALTLRGNVSTSRIETEEPGAAFVRQESPRHAANLGADYDWAAARLSFGGNLSYSSGYTRDANPDAKQTQHVRTQLDLYAVKKLDRARSLRLSIDNVTREGRGDDTLEYAGGALHQREIDRADGVRVVNLSLEGKW